MNVALLLAGGLGLRMGKSSELPKQFFRLSDKPVLFHTVAVFEEEPSVDAIAIVYLPSWEGFLQDSIDRYGVRKVRWLVPGGDTRHASVYAGLTALAKSCPPDTVVLVHDGVRPFITSDVITQNLAMVRQCGNAMTATRCTDTIVCAPDGETVADCRNRDASYAVQTPQSYRLGQGLALYRRAEREGRGVFINCCELFIAYGEAVHLVAGPKNNMKLTTEEDIAFLKAMNELYRRRASVPVKGEPADAP